MTTLPGPTTALLVVLATALAAMTSVLPSGAPLER